MLPAPGRGPVNIHRSPIKQARPANHIMLLSKLVDFAGARSQSLEPMPAVATWSPSNLSFPGWGHSVMTELLTWPNRTIATLLVLQGHFSIPIHDIGYTYLHIEVAGKRSLKPITPLALLSSFSY